MEKIEKDFKKLKNKLGFTTSVTFVRYGYYFENDNDKRNVYSLVVKRNGKSSSFRFGDSVFNTEKKGEKPKDYEIMYAIVMDYYSFYNQDGLRDFMSMFGYEDESIAKKILKKLEKNYNMLNKLFTLEEVEMIAKVYEENNY